MKKKYYLLFILVFGFVGMINTGCEEEPTEYCEPFSVCEEASSVTACCDVDDVCKYTYNGEEYGDSDSELDRLATDLGCPVAYLYPEFDNEKEALKYHLNYLLEITRMNAQELIAK